MAANPALTQQASSGHDDPVVTGLVTRARNGDRQARDALVDRYAPLIWSICRTHRLEGDRRAGWMTPEAWMCHQIAPRLHQPLQRPLQPEKPR
jgi:hypothetical protein